MTGLGELDPYSQMGARGIDAYSLLMSSITAGGRPGWAFLFSVKKIISVYY